MSSPDRESRSFYLIFAEDYFLLRLTSDDGQNRLTMNCLRGLTDIVREIAPLGRPLILAGNKRFFSVGADLNEISALSAPDALTFAKAGQKLMNTIAGFPALTIAAISGYCMGGGLDLALSCRWRIAAPQAVFAHRGAALGLMTGWGGTQRLPLATSVSRAIRAFLLAEQFDARSALQAGLVHEIHTDPLAAAVDMTKQRSSPESF